MRDYQEEEKIEISRILEMIRRQSGVLGEKEKKLDLMETDLNKRKTILEQKINYTKVLVFSGKIAQTISGSITAMHIFRNCTPLHDTENNTHTENNTDAEAIRNFVFGIVALYIFSAARVFTDYTKKITLKTFEDDVEKYEHAIELLKTPPILQQLYNMEMEPLANQSSIETNFFIAEINLILDHIKKLQSEGKTNEEILAATHIKCNMMMSYISPIYHELIGNLIKDDVNKHQYQQTLSTEELEIYKKCMHFIQYAFKKINRKLENGEVIQVLEKLSPSTSEPIIESEGGFLKEINKMLYTIEEAVENQKSLELILELIHRECALIVISTNQEQIELIDKIIKNNVHKHRYLQSLSPKESERYKSFMSLIKHEFRKAWFMIDKEDLPIVQELPLEYIINTQKTTQEIAEGFIDELNHILTRMEKFTKDGKDTQEIQGLIHGDVEKLFKNTSYNKLISDLLLNEGNANINLEFSPLLTQEQSQYQEYMSIIKEKVQFLKKAPSSTTSSRQEAQLLGGIELSLLQHA